MSESGKALLLIAIVVCLALMVQPDCIAALTRRQSPVPKRVLSEAEMQLFTTTANTGEIVMVGTQGLLLDQGSQAVRVGTSAISLLTGGAERVRVLNGGNVGIGTDNPGCKLQIGTSIDPVYPNNPLGYNTVTILGAGRTAPTTSGTNDLGGTLFINSTNPYGQNGGASIALGGKGQNFGGGYPHMTFARISGVQSTWNGAYYGDFVVETMNFGSLYERMRINTNGNVGIGTTNPQDLFHVYGGSMLLGIPNGSTTGTTHYIYTPNSYGQTVGGNSVTQHGCTLVVSAGNLATEQWNGNSTSGQLYLQSGSLNDTGNNGTAGGGYYSGNMYYRTGEVAVRNDGGGNTQYCKPGSHIFQTGNITRNATGTLAGAYTERMRIDALTGNVGIGVASPSNKLQVNGGTTSMWYTSWIGDHSYYAGGGEVWNPGDPTNWPWGGRVFYISFVGYMPAGSICVLGTFLVFHSRWTAQNNNAVHVQAIHNRFVDLNGITDGGMSFVFSSPSAQVVRISVMSILD